MFIPDKREMTPEEEEASMYCYQALYPETDYKTELAECKAQGLKSEVCRCERALPAFIHFVRCQVEDCPMKSKEDARSLLEVICGADPEGATP